MHHGNHELYRLAAHYGPHEGNISVHWLLPKGQPQRLPTRLLFTMRRTRPKGEANPGWQRISWEEALNETASAMVRTSTL